MRLTLRAALAVASAMSMVGISVAIDATTAGASSAPTASMHVTMGSLLRSRTGAATLHSPFKHAPAAPTRGSSFFAGRVGTPKIKGLRQVSAVRASVSAHATGVKISGTFSVSGTPAGRSVEMLALACPGGTTYSIDCGTDQNPGYGAFMKVTKGAHGTSGSYNFGTLPTQSAGWQLGLVFLDGESNGGYYPVSAPVTVALNGSTADVTKALSAAYVAPQLFSTLSVTGAPAGYHYVMDLIACQSSVTPDQLVIYEDFGACAISFGADKSSLGVYLDPGTWTIRYIYEPVKSGVQMEASDDVVNSKFSIVGPTLTVASHSTMTQRAVTTKYVAPSIAGTVVSHLPSKFAESELDFIDTSDQSFAVGVYVNPKPGTSTTFDVFVSPGTYSPQIYVVPPSGFSFSEALSYVQVLFEQAGSNLTVSGSTTRAAHYAVAPYTATIQGGFAIARLGDPDNRSGWDNVQPFSYVTICPASEAFSLECADGFQVSPSEILGGTFTLYDLTTAVTMGFTYATIGGTVVTGPAVTLPASSTLRTATLTAAYSNPTIWGDVTLSESGFQLDSAWVQACPASAAFTPECADGMSVGFGGGIGFGFFAKGQQAGARSPHASSEVFGYGIDLAPGSWRFAVVGTTVSNENPHRLGPIVSTATPSVYPVVNLSAAA